MSALSDFIGALIKSDTESNQKVESTENTPPVTPPTTPPVTPPTTPQTEQHTVTADELQALNDKIKELETQLASAQQANISLLQQTPLGRQHQTVSEILRAQPYHPLYREEH